MSPRTGFALLFSLFAAIGTNARADEPELIWKPVKNSDRSYTARIGAKLPVETPIRAGLEMGMNASRTGQVVDTPVRLWGNVTLLAEQLPGVSLARDVGVLFNALTGSSSVSMTSRQKRIVTPELDIEANRNFTVRYDGTAQQWNGLDVSQSLRLSRSETGTAFVLTGSKPQQLQRVQQRRGRGAEDRRSPDSARNARSGICGSFSAGCECAV